MREAWQVDTPISSIRSAVWIEPPRALYVVHGKDRDLTARARDIPARRTPPRTVNAAGEPRRLGVEIEFGALDIDRSAEVVRRLYGGRVERSDAWRREVKGGRLGDFVVELDARLLHGKLPEKYDKLAALQEFLIDRAGEIAQHLVPMEVACPPLPIDALDELEALPHALGQAGAEGTQEEVFYAFGCQLNPELPALDLPTVLAGFRAFLLLEDRLREVAALDRSRHLLSFADPFPRDYARRVLAPDYAPDLGNLIEDYLADNPTRNRDLDLLPLFAELAPERIAELGDERIKARPTWHYRVPDCRIGDPDWSLTLEWNRWVEVERLAEDETRLRELSRAFLDAGDDRAAWARKLAGSLPAA